MTENYDIYTGERLPNLHKLDLSVSAYLGIRDFDLQAFYDEMHQKWADGDQSFWGEQSALDDFWWIILGVAALALFFGDLIGALIIFPIIFINYAIKLEYRYMYGWVVYMINNDWDFLDDESRLALIDIMENGTTKTYKRREFYDNKIDIYRNGHIMSRLYK